MSVNGHVTDDCQTISHFCHNFFANLYKSSYCADTGTFSLDSLESLNSISAIEKDFCDQDILLQEVAGAIKHLKCNKSPGNDGITAEFYQLFSDILSPFLLEVFIESIKNHKLPPSMTQGVISLIPKQNKDLLFIDNWRPISLLNNDYKILAHILSKRIKYLLDSIIDEAQSGFISNRHISNNIRLVLDILD